jgi:hypothetical protein
MTNNSSIHISPVQANSERHNLREVIPDYVNKDLLEKNPISFNSESIAERLASIKANYKASVGQQMQKKATPIREGVVNLKDVTPDTMDQLKLLSKKLENELGVRCFQIHIHADEGHWEDKQNKQGWKPNYHAHMVFDFTHPETGKGLRLKKHDMIKMQDIVAETLQMTRGKTSDVKHLHHEQFKAQKELEKLQEQNEILEQKKNEVRARIKRLEDSGEESIRSQKEAVRAIFLASTSISEEEERKLLSFDEKALGEVVSEFEREVEQTQNELEELRNKF